MIELKEHNQRPYRELCRMLEQHDKCAYISATGTGKSYVVGKYIEEHGLKDKTLVLVPRNAVKRAWQKLLPGIRIRNYYLMHKQMNDISCFKLIVCDELHHLGAKKWEAAFRNAVSEYHGKIIGLSATPIRYLDQHRNMAEEIFEGYTVEGLDLPQAISEGILPGFQYTTALYDMPKRARKYEDAGNVTDKLVKKLELMKNEYSFKSILRKTLADPNTKAAVFVSNIYALPDIEELVEDVFPDAGHFMIHSRLDRRSIERTINEFTNYDGMAFLYTVDLLNEGIHIDGINAAVMFRRTVSPAVYLQQIGRALSADKSKESVQIIDFVANHTNLKGYEENQRSTIQWIKERIEDPSRQIIVKDYAMEELLFLEKLQRLYEGVWTQEEDDVLRKNYGRDNIDSVLPLLPGRTRGAIRARAGKLGLSEDIRNTYTEEFYHDLETLYPEADGTERMLKKYAFLSRDALYKVAENKGIRKAKTDSTPWSDEEQNILKMNSDRSAEELSLLLPGRTENGIKWKKKALGLKKGKFIWDKHSEEEFKKLFSAGGLAEVQKTELFSWMSRSAVYSKAKELGSRSSRGEDWEQDKIERFRSLYRSGGRPGIEANAEFSSLTPDMISRRVRLYGAARDTHQPTKWTDEDMKILRDYLDTPMEERETITELQKNRIPWKTIEAVRGRIKKIQREERKQASA